MTAGRAKAGAQPLITFRALGTHRPRRVRPTRRPYERRGARLFQAKWPWVRSFSTWNEVNLPREGPANNPKLVGSYYRILKRTFPTSKVLAADLLTCRAWSTGSGASSA